jgi:hypothetical protein
MNTAVNHFIASSPLKRWNYSLPEGGPRGAKEGPKATIFDTPSLPPAPRLIDK